MSKFKSKLIRRGPDQGANLYSAYRPLRFGELYGAAADVAKGLSRQIALNAGKLSQPAVAFTGEAGTGKTTLALILALSLNCLEPERDELGNLTEPCLECARCRGILTRSFDGRDPHYVVKNAAKMKNDDVITMVQEEIDGGTSLMKHARGTRVICLEEAHNLTKKGIENLLLPVENVLTNTKKTRVHILLTSSEYDTLFTNKAWKSRILTYKLRPWSEEELFNILVDVNLNEYKYLKRPKVQRSVLNRIIKVSDGSLRQCITLLQAVLEQIEPNAEGTIELSATRTVLEVYIEEEDHFKDFIDSLIYANETKCYKILRDFYTSRSSIAPEAVSSGVVRTLSSMGINLLAKGDSKGIRLMRMARTFNSTIGTSIFQDRYTVLALATAAALECES
ncbi:hypothetical protein CL621_01000 [archaeon]|nr:hypothetical protein [archaeon]